MNWFLRSLPGLSLAPAPWHHVKYFLLCSSDIIDWLQIFPVKYFWSVCALNIFYLSGMIEPWPPMWQDGVFYWAQRILDKLSAGSAVTKFRYKLTIEMSPATTSANHRPATWTPDLCWPMRGEELPDDKIMVITGREIMTRSETCRHWLWTVITTPLRLLLLAGLNSIPHCLYINKSILNLLSNNLKEKSRLRRHSTSLKSNPI